MKRVVFGSAIFLLLAVNVFVVLAWDIRIGGLQAISISASDFSYNPATGLLEASGQDAFQVQIKTAGALSGSVQITSVTCPITGQTSSGSSAGYLSAELSRTDLILPSPSVTDVVLTVSIAAPLTVAPAKYSNGLVEITATVQF